MYCISTSRAIKSSRLSGIDNDTANVIILMLQGHAPPFSMHVCYNLPKRLTKKKMSMSTMMKCTTPLKTPTLSTNHIFVLQWIN